MKKDRVKIYKTPVIEAVEVEVEKGFAQSGNGFDMDINDWGNDGNDYGGTV